MNELNQYRINDLKYAQSRLKEHLDQANVVLFYESNHYYLSNFSAFMVQYEGNLWPTSEHLYHSFKFTQHKDIFDEILTAKSAHESLKIARREKHKVDPQWENHKVSVMKMVLELKLGQHPYIQKKLKQTLGVSLIEDSHRDPFWGRGQDWNGENWLGRCWVTVRDKYFENSTD